MSASPRFVRHAQPGWDCCPGEGRDAHAEKEGAAIGGAEDGHRNAERTLSQYIRSAFTNCGTLEELYGDIEEVTKRSCTICYLELFSLASKIV